MSRPPVEATKRRAMTLARKRRIHEAHDGKCAECKEPVPLTGPGVTYDHRVPIWFGSPDEDDEMRPLCDSCDAAKTSADQTRIAKTKRQQNMGKPREPKMRSGRKLTSRGFPTNLRRRFDGAVEPR